MTLKTSQPLVRQERLIKVVCEQLVTTPLKPTLTAGVLTKPDTVAKGEHDNWLRILQNKNHILKHGWYVTRQCSAEELSKNLAWEKVREMEQSFFGQEPWCKLDRSRFGTPRLVSALSTLLSTMIQERHLIVVFQS